MNEEDAAAMEYVTNKFLPYLFIFLLLFTGLELTDFRPWVIALLIIFIDKYSFKIGRSVGEYENNPLFRNSVDETLDDE